MVLITDVLPNSRAAKAGIMAGDTLVSINEREINDVLDYRFHLANKRIYLKLLRNGEELSKQIIKVNTTILVWILKHLLWTKSILVKISVFSAS